MATKKVSVAEKVKLIAQARAMVKILFDGAEIEVTFEMFTELDDEPGESAA